MTFCHTSAEDHFNIGSPCRMIQSSCRADTDGCLDAGFARRTGGSSCRGHALGHFPWSAEFGIASPVEVKNEKKTSDNNVEINEE
ncbi:MAG: hypothetical protein P8130_06490 [Deltaproteobacteria bacterium]